MVIGALCMAGCGGSARGAGRFFLFGFMSSDSGVDWAIVIIIWVFLVALVMILAVPMLKGGAVFGLAYLITGAAMGLDSALVISGIAGGIVFFTALGSRDAGGGG